MKQELILYLDDKENMTEDEYYSKLIAARFCPKCNKGILVPRKNSSNNELFLGCSNYAYNGCNFTIDIDDYIDISTNYRIQHQDEINILDIYDHLFTNAEEALISSIEIYNKPLWSYKFQTSLILLINAWELLLKAIIVKSTTLKEIMSTDQNTISFDDSIKKVIEIDMLNISTSTKENLLVLYDIRNNYTHFYSEKIETILYSLMSKSIDEFIKLALKYFKFKNQELLTMQCLPIFFNINKTTIQELKAIQNSKDMFIKSLADRIINFATSKKDKDSIMYNVDINLQTVKNFKNADLIFGLNNKSDYTINLEKKYILGKKSDKGLQKITLTDDEINEKYPYIYDNLIELKQKKGDYKKIQDFIKNIRTVDNSLEYCYEKNKHPQRKTGSYFIYSQKCYDEIVELIKE